MTTIELFHGSSGISTGGILHDFQNSPQDRRLGRGIYLTPDKNAAESIAIHRMNSQGDNGYVVFSFRVKMNKVKEMPFSVTCKKWQNEGYDACKSIHPPWRNLVNGFVEYCILDKSQLSVKDIYSKGNIECNFDISCENLYI
eukprot:gene2173-2037_t